MKSMENLRCSKAKKQASQENFTINDVKLVGSSCSSLPIKQKVKTLFWIKETTPFMQGFLRSAYRGDPNNNTRMFRISSKNIFDLRKHQDILKVWKATITINLLKLKFVSGVFHEKNKMK